MAALVVLAALAFGANSGFSAAYLAASFTGVAIVLFTATLVGAAISLTLAVSLVFTALV